MEFGTQGDVPALAVERLGAVPHGETQPLRRLMVAVLREATGCYQRYYLDSTQRGRRLFKEAERWFMVDDTPAPLRFAEICELLGLDADYFRRCLYQWQAREVVRRRNAVLQRVRAPQVVARAGGAPSAAAGVRGKVAMRISSSFVSRRARSTSTRI